MRLITSTTMLCALLLSAIYTPTQAAELEKIFLGGGSFTTYVARTNGIYAEFGLDVDVPRLDSSDAVRSALASGSVQMADFGVDNALAMAETSKTDVVIIMAGESSPIQLVGQKGLGNVDDLRGKTMLVDAPNTQNAVIMKRILSRAGLEPGRDYQMREAGGQPLRITAMQKDPSVAGTMVAWPVFFQMKAEGYPSFGSSLDVVGPMLFFGTFLKRDWAQSHRDLVIRYLSANVKAVRWMMARENKADVIRLLTQSRGLSSDVASIAYDGFMGPYGWAHDGQVDLSRLANLMKVRADVEGSWGGKSPPPETYLDMSYLQDALRKLDKN